MNHVKNSIYYTILGFIVIGSLLLFPIATRNEAPSDEVLISIVSGETDLDDELPGGDNGFLERFDFEQEGRGRR